MKKRLLLLLSTSFIIFLTSCNKDDDAKPKDDLIGKWELNYVKYEIQNNQAAADSLNGNYSPFFHTRFNAARIILELNEDKTFKEEWVLIDASRDSEEGEWERTESALTLSYDLGDDEFAIEKLDIDDLELGIDSKIAVQDPNFPDDQNKVITLDVRWTFVYSK